MEKIRRPRVRISTAIEWADGNQSKLAKRLGITRQFISKMKKKNLVYLPDLYSALIAYVRPDLVEKD